MKHFKHMQAASAKEAAKNAEAGTAAFIAGGTDLLGTLKDESLPTYPETVIDLKTIPDMDGIVEDGDAVRIGALATLAAVAESETVQANCAALAEACARAASPTIRHRGTIGGNVCQMHRCWYFRVPDDRFHCLRKGGDFCPARIGDNRYHSIFGDQDGCYAVSSHDTAPALVALGATVLSEGSPAAGLALVSLLSLFVLALNPIVGERLDRRARRRGAGGRAQGAAREGEAGKSLGAGPAGMGPDPQAMAAAEAAGRKARAALMQVFAEQHDMTAREADVLTLLCQGRTRTYIAAELGISPNTVKGYIHNVYRKANAADKQDLIDRVDLFIERS